MHVLLALGLWLLAVIPASAARTVPADTPLVVRLALGQPTAIALPEPIRSVTVGLDQQVMSADYDGPYLFLIVLDPTVTGRVFIVGASGTLYALTFRVGTPADDVVHITPPPPQALPPPAPPLSVSTVLRALRTQTAIPGQQPSEAPPPHPHDPRLRLDQLTALRAGSFVGMTFTVHNTQQAPLTLDIRVGDPTDMGMDGIVHLERWVWPPWLTLRAVAADHDVLEPGGATRVIAVFERRP